MRHPIGLILSTAVLALLTACGGDGYAPAASSANSVRVLASQEPAGSRCPAGGARIDAGIDANGNGVLDANEIGSTQYVCDGSAGAAGAKGATGATGSSGLATLVKLGAEAAGPQCAVAGTRIDAGADANGNGVLDAAEIMSTAYVCGSPSGANGTNGLDTLMRISSELAGTNCANGGNKVEAGRDTDGNGTLEAAEVTATNYVCNGSNGAAGSNGVNALLAVVAEAPGVNCAAGGSKVSSGADANGNAQLDAGEVTSTAYVCNGIAGATGAQGATGTNGANGANGYTTLIASTVESVGSNCSAGGIKITSGPDTDRNGTLDSGEVTATSYACNGLSSIGWIDVTTTGALATINTGYVADNAAQVTITLPASPSVGGVVSVSGAAAGGWRIAQRAGQSVVTTNLPVSGYGRSWTTAAMTSQDWHAVASSADGTRLVAAPYSADIFTSADGGTTWIDTGVAHGWTALASSADGRQLVAGTFFDGIFLSTDYGASWTYAGHNDSDRAAASSADGAVLVVAPSNNALVVSTDHGTTWTQRETGRDWTGVAVSADGSRIVACANGDRILVSSDFGVTWVAQATVQAWHAVASSADGSKLVAAASGGQLWTSNDFGNTWTARGPVNGWESVASSSDGTRLLAVGTDINDTVGKLYTSIDQGVTWTQRSPADEWITATSSADGDRIIAAAHQSTFGQGLLVTSTPSSVSSTTTGTGGGITGGQYQSIELQYIGSGRWSVLDSTGVDFGVQ